MHKTISCKDWILAFLVSGMLAASPALAQKPSWAGGDKGDKKDKYEKGNKGNSGNKGNAGKGRDNAKGPDRDNARGGSRVVTHFSDQHRVVIREYYGEQYRTGRCPPGLAKKNNGCMPPRQAKKWQVGRPLPRDVIFYDLPPAVVIRLGQPPAGHRYVGVAADILLIAIGTSMVVDAIQDLSRM